MCSSICLGESLYATTFNKPCGEFSSSGRHASRRIDFDRQFVFAVFFDRFECFSTCGLIIQEAFEGFDGGDE